MIISPRFDWRQELARSRAQNPSTERTKRMALCLYMIAHPIRSH